ncbi:MAG: pyridoxamine 5'-phosphate oxidase [Saprospiraceae bacterium]
MKKTDIKKLREDYSKGILKPSDLMDHPLKQFINWFEEAVDFGVKEPNAMILSTIDKNNSPSSRTVLMKESNDHGIVFYTNLESDKALHIARNNKVSVLFLWLEMERQVRMIGTATIVGNNTATKYFQTRPKASQIGAWASAQSKILEDRKTLESKVKKLQEQYKNEDVLPKPSFWGGYLIKPSQIEFWQGRRNRLHDRLRYNQLDNGDWNLIRLNP